MDVHLHFERVRVLFSTVSKLTVIDPPTLDCVWVVHLHFLYIESFTHVIHSVHSYVTRRISRAYRQSGLPMIVCALKVSSFDWCD